MTDTERILLDALELLVDTVEDARMYVMGADIHRQLGDGCAKARAVIAKAKEGVKV